MFTTLEYSAKIAGNHASLKTARAADLGLAAAAEIRTDTRRVVDYLLSPLERRVRSWERKMSLLVRPAIAGAGGSLVFGLFFGSPFLAIWIAAWAALAAGARSFKFDQKLRFSSNTGHAIILLGPTLLAALGYLFVVPFLDQSCPSRSLLIDLQIKNEAVCRAAIILDLSLIVSLSMATVAFSVWNFIQNPIQDRKTHLQIMSWTYVIMATLGAIYLMQSVWIVADGRRSLFINVTRVAGLTFQSFVLSWLVIFCSCAVMNGLTSAIETMLRREVP